MGKFKQVIDLITLNDFKIKCKPIGRDYSDLNWLMAIDNALSYSVLVAVQFFSTERWLALPVFFRKMGPVKFCGAPLPGSFTGDYDVISSDNRLNLDLKINFLFELQSYLKKLGCSYIELPFLSAKDTETLNHKNNSIKEIKNLIVDIPDLDETWRSFSGRARTAIKKARSSNLTVKIVEKNKENVNVTYDMIQQTFTNKGLLTPHQVELFYALAELDFVKFLWVYHQDTVTAVGVFGFFDTKCVYLSGAMTAEGAKLNASSLLQWAAMQEGNRLGLDKYDLGGMGDPRVDKFKKSFSNNECTRVRVIYASKLWRLIYPIADFLRNKRLLQVN